jgi:hypothetical protein
MIDLSKYDLCTFLGKNKGRSHYDTRKPKSIEYFSILVKIFIQIGLYIFSLIYRAGDVDLNLGPTSYISDLSDYSTDQGDPSISRRYKDMVSFSCLNVQNLRQKVDIVEAELGGMDIILLTETWLNSSIADGNVVLTSYKHPYRKDRDDGRLEGGVIIYVKESIPSKRRINLEIPNLERIWVELIVNKSNILFGLFYRPPDSNPGMWDLINLSIENALNSGVDNIVISGDFNENLLNPNKTKLANIILQNGLYQTITEPT